jgi:hypothetical protein
MVKKTWRNKLTALRSTARRNNLHTEAAVRQHAAVIIFVIIFVVVVVVGGRGGFVVAALCTYHASPDILTAVGRLRWTERSAVR